MAIPPTLHKHLAAKAGVDLSVKLYEITKGDVALLCAVYESATLDDRFRLRLSSVCPHGISVNSITLALPKGAPLRVFLLRESFRGLGWETRSQPAVLQPEIPGRAAIQVASAFVVPPLRTQEVVVEIERAPVLARICNKPGATLSIDYNVLGEDGDAKDLKVKILLRDDHPCRLAFSRRTLERGPKRRSLGSSATPHGQGSAPLAQVVDCSAFRRASLARRPS